jgi:hypothetical protein
MSATKLRDKIADRLSSFIGTYTLTNEETTPAIYCAHSGDASSNDRTCNGLEIVVVNSPNHNYVLYLKSWARTNLEPIVDLDAIIAKLESEFVVSHQETIVIPEQPELRFVVKLTIDANSIFTYDDDFLD